MCTLLQTIASIIKINRKFFINHSLLLKSVVFLDDALSNSVIIFDDISCEQQDYVRAYFFILIFYQDDVLRHTYKNHVTTDMPILGRVQLAMYRRRSVVCSFLFYLYDLIYNRYFLSYDCHQNIYYDMKINYGHNNGN